MVFSDICGFTGISERVPPNRMLMALHNVFLALDHVVGALKAYKYEVTPR